MGGRCTATRYTLLCILFCSNSKTVVAVQTEEENVKTKWMKREKALAVVLVILVGTVGIMWWHVRILSRNSEGETYMFFKNSE